MRRGKGRAGGGEEGVGEGRVNVCGLCVDTNDTNEPK